MAELASDFLEMRDFFKPEFFMQGHTRRIGLRDAADGQVIAVAGQMTQQGAVQGTACAARLHAVLHVHAGFDRAAVGAARATAWRRRSR